MITALLKERMGPLFERTPTRGGNMHDQLTVGALIDPTLVKVQELYVDVDINHGPNYGVSVGAPKIWEGGEGAKKVTVQYDVDFDRFIRMFVDRLTRK
jgi:inosine-uridine nucleoside N-ribohydrolase